MLKLEEIKRTSHNVQLKQKLLHNTMTDRASRGLRQRTGYCLAQNEVTGCALRMAQQNLRIATVKNTLNNEDVDSKRYPSKYWEDKLEE